MNGTGEAIKAEGTRSKNGHSKLRFENVDRPRYPPDYYFVSSRFNKSGSRNALIPSARPSVRRVIEIFAAMILLRLVQHLLRKTECLSKN